MGIAVPRSAEMVVAVWAVLKAGAAYLPLDPDYPTRRLRHMVSTAAPRLILTTAAAAARIEALAAAEMVLLDAEDTRDLLAALPPDRLVPSPGNRIRAGRA